MAAPEETHYVLIVHGTWNPPHEGQRLWYQLDDADSQNFCTKLNSALEYFGMEGAVWRSLNGKVTEFGWSGANRHEDRIAAARQLAKRIVEITTADPTARIHLVAHSHGGNVVLGAIQLYLTWLHWQAQTLWSVDNPEERRKVLVQASNISRPSPYHTFDEAPTEAFLPIELPPVKECMEAFGLGNIDLLTKGWREARREYTDDTVQTGPFGDFPPPDLGEFKSWWAQSPLHNRLGRLVFLGTPFIHKRWGFPGRRGPWPKLRWTYIGVETACWSAMLAIIAYVLIEMLWFSIAVAASLFNRPIHGPTMNPLAWPFWLHIAWLPFVLFAFGLAMFLTSSRSELNLYFEDTLTGYLLLNYPVRMTSDAVLPLKALVITSGLLDEVLLGMFSEPIVKAVIDDQVNRLVFETHERPSRPPTGIAQGVFTPILSRTIYRARVAAKFALRPVLWPVKALLARYMRRKLFELVKTTGYGVEASELRDASVEVDVYPRLRRVIEDHLWVVTGDLAREPPSRAEGSAVERYAFLWDRNALQKQVSKSTLFEHLWPLLVQRDPASGARLPLDDTTSAIILTLEERIRELLGLVDLSHSHYYSNDEVIAGIARFIATAQRAASA
jgi:hypothetical protein